MWVPWGLMLYGCRSIVTRRAEGVNPQVIDENYSACNNTQRYLSHDWLSSPFFIGGTVVDRYWLITWTTYGTWLPGDQRGFVSFVRDNDGAQIIHNEPKTAYDHDNPALKNTMQSRMKGKAIWLSQDQAVVVMNQIQETTQFREWQLSAVAVMSNHVHLVVGVPGDPEPESILHSYKSYASRALNKEWKKPINGSWWTKSGSTRKLPDNIAVKNAVEYVFNQDHTLAVWATIPEP